MSGAFPTPLDTRTLGLRTDAGYRFGGFRPGLFLEPLATIKASWSPLDDFAREGNSIDPTHDVHRRAG